MHMLIVSDGFDAHPSHLPRTPVARAAGLARAAMIFRKQLKQGILEPDITKEGPICMDTFRYLTFQFKQYVSYSCPGGCSIVAAYQVRKAWIGVLHTRNLATRVIRAISSSSETTDFGRWRQRIMDGFLARLNLKSWFDPYP